MRNSILKVREDGSLMVEILAIEDWDGFESIGNYLAKYFNAIFIDKLDGPDSRVWLGNIGGHAVKLHHDSYGNTLFGAADARPVLESIVNDLEERLS